MKFGASLEEAFEKPMKVEVNGKIKATLPRDGYFRFRIDDKGDVFLYAIRKQA